MGFHLRNGALIGAPKLQSSALSCCGLRGGEQRVADEALPSLLLLPDSGKMKKLSRLSKAGKPGGWLSHFLLCLKDSTAVENSYMTAGLSCRFLLNVKPIQCSSQREQSSGQENTFQEEMSETGCVVLESRLDEISRAEKNV